VTCPSDFAPRFWQGRVRGGRGWFPEYLGQREQAASDAGSFVEGMSKEEFLADTRTQQAVVMSLLIIGAAVAKIIGRYPAFIEQHSEIQWRGMRNRIAHGWPSCVAESS
jgi:uncharacterized protein with HEPN domain